MNYDTWLEAPYQEMYEASDLFVDWCESEDLDPDDPASYEAYEAWCEDEAEAAAEARAEARAEWLEYDREDW